MEFPSKTEQMFEQMFNISPKIYVKLVLPLSSGVTVTLFDFPFAPLPLSDFALSRFFCFAGDALSCYRRANAKTTTRQHPPLFPPQFRQVGGASGASRQFLWHKVLTSAPCSRLPADTNGGNWAKFTHQRPILTFFRSSPDILMK